VGATAERAGFEPGPTPAGLRSLIEPALRALPALAHLPIAEAWAGYRPGTPDGLPILGPDPEVDGVWYATGHFRNGVLLAPVTADVIAAAIDGAPTAPGIGAFRSDRFEEAS
jgi:glycine/D-amino acid oxidase-like deaminating enzyme